MTRLKEHEDEAKKQENGIGTQMTALQFQNGDSSDTPGLPPGARCHSGPASIQTEL